MDLVPVLKTMIVTWILVGATIYIFAVASLLTAWLAVRLETTQPRVVLSLIRGFIVACVMGPFAGLRAMMNIQRGRNDE